MDGPATEDSFDGIEDDENLRDRRHRYGGFHRGGMSKVRAFRQHVSCRERSAMLRATLGGLNATEVHQPRLVYLNTCRKSSYACDLV